MNFSGIAFSPISALPASTGSAYDKVLSIGSVGNVTVGAGGSIYGVGMIVTTVGDVVGFPSQALYNSLTLTTIGTAGGAGGFQAFSTLTISGVSAIDMLAGFMFTKTLTLTTIGTTVCLAGQNVGLIISSAASINLLPTVTVRSSLIVAGVSTVTTSTIGTFNHYQTLTAIGNVTSPGGLVIFIGMPIEGVSGITLLPGVGHFKTLSIDCIASVTGDGQISKNEYLTISGVSDITISHLFKALNTLTIAGINGISITTAFSYGLTLTLSSIATINIGGLFNQLFVSGFSACGVSLLPTTGTAELMGGQSAVTVTSTAIFVRNVIHTLLLIDVVVKKKPTEIIDSLVQMVDFVTVQRIRQGIASDAFALTDGADWYRQFGSILTFTDSVSVIKVKYISVSDQFILTDYTSKLATYHMSIVDTLDFNKPNVRTTPLITAGNNQVSYVVPTVNLILVPKRCLIILGVPSQTIIMPCPLFGDTQQLSGTLNLKRTMTGDTYTYVRQTTLQRLKYSFDIWTDKYLELRYFILNHSHEQMTLINHKSETWYLYLMNNPTEFIAQGRWQPKGEKYNLTLEFEGVKVS